MCGRFTLAVTPEEVEDFFGVHDFVPFPPRYNIPPTEPILAVISAGPRQPGSNQPARRSVLVRWGLIPAWAKNPKELPLLFNARAETAAEKAAFKAAMRHRRVLIPASGFYEWKHRGTRKAQPYFVRPKGGGLVAFAGLIETYAEANGSEIDTGAILTTPANAEFASIHERMPAVIEPGDFDRWLDCRTQEPRDVADLLRPVRQGFFEAIPVSDKVNAVANTGPDVQEPIDHAEDFEAPAGKAGADPQLSLF
jgi:putative SOS response-associated peptidase YedK